MASNGPCPHLHSLCLGLATHQPSRRQYAQSLLGPSLFHDPRTPHVLESHPERAVPLSRRDDERQHAIGLHSAIALRLYLAACNTSSSCRFSTCLLQCVSTVSILLNHRNLIFEPVWVFLTFKFSSSAFCFFDTNRLHFESLFAIWSLSPNYVAIYTTPISCHLLLFGTDPKLMPLTTRGNPWRLRVWASPNSFGLIVESSG